MDEQDHSGWAELGRAAIDGVLVVDNAGRVRLSNDVVTGMLKVPRASIVGVDLASFLSPPLGMLRERPSGQRVDGIMRSATGAETHVHVWTRPASDGATAIVLRDASEWEVARTTLSLVAAGVEHATDAFEITDAEGRVEYANGAHAVLTGYPLFEVIGEKLTRFVDDVGTGRGDIERAIRAGEAWRGEVQCTHKTDGSRIQDLAITPVLDGRGDLQRFVAIRRDVTDRVEMERVGEELRAQLALAERASIVGRLAASVAHEVNNPATSILANIEVARDEIDQLAREIELTRVTSTPEERVLFESWWRKIRIDERLSALSDALADSSESTERVVALGRELRAFVRQESSRATLLSINDVVKAAARLARVHLDGRAELIVELGNVPRVIANPMRLGQVVMNLLVNAAQSIGAGAKDDHKVELRTFVRGGDVMLTVEDSGAGIAPEHLPRVFDPFFTTKPLGEGAGLGLAVSRDIVEAAGGDIRVESEGKGTRVIIRLPAAPEASHAKSTT